MKVWPYKAGGRWYWVAETPDGIRTRAFLGGSPGDLSAANTALAAAKVIYFESGIMGEQVWTALGQLLPCPVNLRNTALDGRILRISSPVDPVLCGAELPDGEWVDAPCYGPSINTAAIRAARLLAAGESQPVVMFRDIEWWATNLDQTVGPAPAR